MKKKTTILCGCIATVLFLVACKDKNGNPSENSTVFTESTLDTMPQNGVPFDTAFENIKRYVTLRNKDFGIDSQKVVRSYTVSARDMLGVMQINQEYFAHLKYDTCRVYLGLDKAGQFKLYMTPVKYTKDVFLYYLNPGNENVDTDTMYYVYDLNAPCPKTCDSLSPLYTFDAKRYLSR